jgi:hypothetical protein
MDLTPSRNAVLPQVDRAAPNAPNQDLVEGRRELARLIGRLLAHRWLEEQRAGSQGLSPVLSCGTSRNAE